VENDNGHEEIDELGGIATAEAEHEVFKGARIKIGDLEREDGIIAEAASKIGRSNMGVLLRAMSAIPSDKEYRQILKAGNYQTREKAREAVKAMAENRFCGYEEGVTAILDDITAQSAGENQSLIFKVFETLTHTTFTSNSSAPRKWWGKNDTGKSNASPLS
jgi:hypothetical protein